MEDSNHATIRNHRSSEHDPEEERDFGSHVHETFGNRADYFLDVVRIYLGIGLFVKGIQFLVNSDFAGAAQMNTDTSQPTGDNTTIDSAPTDA